MFPLKTFHIFANENQSQMLLNFMVSNERTMTRQLLGIAIFLLSCCHIQPASAQDFALKTNLLGWATTSLNAGAEWATGTRHSMQVFGTMNPWTFNDGKRVRFWNVMPEYRYWTCRTFGGSFFGIHALGGQYNIRNVDLPFKTLPKQGKDGRHYEGWYIGGGVTYGYQWLLSKHWNLEAEIGVGYAYSPYKLYGTCKRCLNKDHRNYVGPTKVGISLVYFP